MRILIISREFPPLVGGVGSFTLNLALGLKEIGKLVQVLTSAPMSGSESFTDVQTLRTSDFFNGKILKVAALLCKALITYNRSSVDKMIAMTWTHEGLCAYILSKLKSIPYVVIAHGTEILRCNHSCLKKILMRTVMSGAEVIVANSTFTKLSLIDLGIPHTRIIVVNPPVRMVGNSHYDTSIIDRKLDLTGKLVLFTAARLVRRKGHHRVIRLLGELRHAYPSLVYVITGEGPTMRELKESAEACHVGDRLRMTGYISPAEVKWLHRRADIYISPGLRDGCDVEGFGIALMEAAFGGTPTIAGNVGGAAEAVVDGVTGFVVDASNMEQIKKAVVTLLDEPDLRRRFGEAGQKWASTFSPRRQAEKMARILE